MQGVNANQLFGPGQIESHPAVPSGALHRRPYHNPNHKVKSPDISRFKLMWYKPGKHKPEKKLGSLDILERYIEGIKQFSCNEELAYEQLHVFLQKQIKQHQVATAMIFMSLDGVPYRDSREYGTTWPLVVYKWTLRKGPSNPSGRMKWRPGDGPYDVSADLTYWRQMYALYQQRPGRAR